MKGNTNWMILSRCELDFIETNEEREKRRAALILLG